MKLIHKMYADLLNWQEQRVYEKVIKERKLFYPFVNSWYCIREYIEEDSRYAYAFCNESPWFFKYLFRTKWNQISSVISQDPYTAYLYAKNILKGRWIKAEDVIKKDVERWIHYRSMLGTKEYSRRIQWKWLRSEI